MTGAANAMPPVDTSNREPMFALDQASYAISDRTLLHPVSVALARQCVTGLIGHNGSGKSTLLKLMARQLTPTAGSIQLANVPLALWKERSLARKVAYLPQAPSPAPGMLVRELVALGRYPWHGALGRFGPVDRAKVAEALSLTSLHRLADRVVDTLSGGERQRAWLAMLIAQDADCLLLDEPISALDVAHQIELLALVRELAATRRLCVVMVLHDVNMAARFCDTIVALHSGRMIACGEPAAIVTAEQLRAIYGIDMDVLAHPRGYPLTFPR